MSKHTTLEQLKKFGVRTKAELDVLSAKLGSIPADKDIVQMINEAKASATYDDTDIQAKLTALVGTDANKSARAIAAEELAKQMIPEGAKESLDTLAEIAAWIQAHPDDAAAINKAISDLEDLVGTLPEGTTATTVTGYIKEYADAAIAALNAGDFAKAADLTALAARVAAVETDRHTHANQDALDAFEVASDAEVDAMLNEVFGAPAA